MRLTRAKASAAGIAALLAATGTAFGFAGMQSVQETAGALPMVAPSTTTAPRPTTTVAPTTTAPTTTSSLPPTTVPPTTAPPSTAPPVTEAPAPVEPVHEEPVEEVVYEAPAPVEPTPVEAAPAAPVYGPASQSPAEDQFLALTNGTRAAAGLAALRSDAGLHAYAVQQAQAMAAAGHIYHSDISTLLGTWYTVGENVGVGPSVGPIHDALVASPGHYANIAHTGYTSMGVGVVVDAAGRLWTAHVFGA